jgi:hypothetical protein
MSSARRATEEAERLAARQLEAVVREATWRDAQAERLLAELERARTAIAALDDGAPAVQPVPPGEGSARADVAAIAAWEGRPSFGRGATGWPRRPGLARRVAARRSTGVPGRRPPPSWPMNGQGAPSGTSRRSASVTGH